MLSSVLRSPRAIEVNIEIMRAFVRLRLMLAEHADLARKLGTLEKRYNAKFRVVFDVRGPGAAAPGETECEVMALERCFATAAEACAAIGCSAEQCQVMYSMPMQVSCG